MTLSIPAPESSALPRPRRRSLGVTRAASLGFSLLAVGALLFMLAMFVVESLPVWRHEGTGYLSGKVWFYRREVFGAASMIYGTIIVAIVAMALAAPIGIGAAIFTAEYLPRRPRLAVKLMIELLAGIPSVVYGLLGILLLRTYVSDGLGAVGVEMLYGGDSLLTAGLLLAVMVLPTIMTLADDALRAVPAAQRSAARGLGLTRAQMILSISLPQARRGLVAALLLALGRALGEMIAVFLVVGKRDNQWPASLLSLRPLVDPGQTLSSKLGGSETPDSYGDPLHWGAVVGLGLILLLLVGVVTAAAAWLSGKGDVHD